MLWANSSAMITIILRLSIRWFVFIMSLELINTCSSYCMVDLIRTEPSLIKSTYRNIQILYLKLAIDFFFFALIYHSNPTFTTSLVLPPGLNWKRNVKFNAQRNRMARGIVFPVMVEEVEYLWKLSTAKEREVGWVIETEETSILWTESWDHWDLRWFETFFLSSRSASK